MARNPKKSRSFCPIDYGLDIFGDRWTLLLIRDLLFAGKRHFKDMMESPERIASNILAARLKKLEDRGLISRAADPGNRKQVVYQLTEKGRDLTPVLVELARWGGRHDPDTPVPQWFAKGARHDHDAMVQQTREAMMEAARKMQARAAARPAQRRRS